MLELLRLVRQTYLTRARILKRALISVSLHAYEKEQVQGRDGPPSESRAWNDDERKHVQLRSHNDDEDHRGGDSAQGEAISWT